MDTENEQVNDVLTGLSIDTTKVQQGEEFLYNAKRKASILDIYDEYKIVKDNLQSGNVQQAKQAEYDKLSKEYDARMKELNENPEKKEKRLYEFSIETGLLKINEAEAEHLNAMVNKLANRIKGFNNDTGVSGFELDGGIEEIQDATFNDLKYVYLIVAISIAAYWSTIGGPFTKEKIAKAIAGKLHKPEGKLLSNLIGPMIFGFLDNAGMVVGFDAIEQILKQQGVTDSKLLAMLGNTFSDAIGSLAGNSVSSALVSHTAYDGDSDTIMELVGISAGCLLPAAFLYYRQTGNKIALVYIALCCGGAAFLMFRGGKKAMTEQEKQKYFEQSIQQARERYKIQ